MNGSGTIQRKLRRLHISLQPCTRAAFEFLQAPDRLHKVQQIRVLFSELDVESGHDSIKIYNGAVPAAARLVREISGSITQTLFSEGVSVDSDVVLVHFHSDGSMQRQGFVASYSTTVVSVRSSVVQTDAPISYQSRTAVPTVSIAIQPVVHRAGHQLRGCEDMMRSSAPSGTVPLLYRP